MNEKELSNKKKELLDSYWTEDLHHSLEELDPEDARSIVDSMNDFEIDYKVNTRQYQEDYIGDYLEYLWEISEVAYWRHVRVSINLEKGLLWSDNMFHFEKMCRYDIPNDLLKAVFEFAVTCDNEIVQDIEAIGCVIKAQCDRFERLDDINVYISLLSQEKKEVAQKRIAEMLKKDCHYRFY